MSDVCTLRIWLSGPLQSWGVQSRFETRATEPAPSKSGVIGLVCAALGRGRAEPVDDLAALRFGVRVEREGSVLSDFHTVGAGTDAVAVASGGTGRGIVTTRYYLQDAEFVAGLESADRTLLVEVCDALRRPRWPLALGRRSCPPAGPLVDGRALVGERLEEALRKTWRPDGVEPRQDSQSAQVELLIEAEEGDLGAEDQPRGSAYRDRTFSPRRIQSCWIEREAQ